MNKATGSNWQEEQVTRQRRRQQSRFAAQEYLRSIAQGQPMRPITGDDTAAFLDVIANGKNAWAGAAALLHPDLPEEVIRKIVRRPGGTTSEGALLAASHPCSDLGTRLLAVRICDGAGLALRMRRNKMVDERILEISSLLAGFLYQSRAATYADLGTSLHGLNPVQWEIFQTLLQDHYRSRDYHQSVTQNFDVIRRERAVRQMIRAAKKDLKGKGTCQVRVGCCL